MRFPRPWPLRFRRGENGIHNFPGVGLGRSMVGGKSLGKVSIVHGAVLSSVLNLDHHILSDQRELLGYGRSTEALVTAADRLVSGAMRCGHGRHPALRGLVLAPVRQATSDRRR